MKAEQMIEYLNGLGAQDADALRNLLGVKVNANPVLAGDRTIEAVHVPTSGLHTAKAQGSNKISVLALLAGVATAAARLENPDAPAIRFRLGESNGAPVVKLAPAD